MKNVNDAIAATRFLDERKEAGLPIPTAAQVARAQRAAENPFNRRFRTPLGLQQLALNIPLTSMERRLNRETGTVLKPAQTRGDNIVVEAEAESVKAFVEANPTMTESEAAGAIAGMHGYTEQGLKQALRRVDRYTRQPEDGRRISTHLREKMVMFSAIAKAALLIRARPAPEAVA